jgi:hypothetical protein
MHKTLPLRAVATSGTTLGSGEFECAAEILRPNLKILYQLVTAMSLYYEAAAILTNAEKTGGTLKSRIYKAKDLKSSAANIYALVSEATKWSGVLKEVVERSGILALEKKVCYAVEEDKIAVRFCRIVD